MVENGTSAAGYEAELAKTRADIAARTEIAARNPGDIEKRVHLAYRQYHLGSLTEAEADFAPVQATIAGILTDFGPAEDICLLQANIDGRFHRLNAVKEDLARCPSLAARPAGRAILADIDFEEGRYEEARQACEALVDEARSWDGLARLAHWHEKLGDKEQADRLYAEAEDELSAKEMRSFAWLELRRGDLARTQGRYDRARAHYRRADAAFPGHWWADKHGAALLAAEGALADAAVLMRNVVTRAPKPEFRQALGELLRELGHHDEAQAEFNAALTVFVASAESGSVHYYHHLADFHADGRPEEAVYWARKDVALRPGFSTQALLAWTLHRNGENAEGLEWISRALSSGVQDSGIFATASALSHAAGDTEQTARYERAAAAINPVGAVFHLHI